MESIRTRPARTHAGKVASRRMWGIAAVGLIAVAIASFGWARAATHGPAPITLTVSTAVPVFTPRVVLAAPHQPIVFTNNSDATLQVTTTPHNPAAFHLSIAPGSSGRIALTRPGLYHFYDAATAHVIDRAAGNDVVHALPGAPNPYLPDQGWIVVSDSGSLGLPKRIDVPAGNDLMDPLVAAIRVGGSIIIHNHDSDPHNLVTDPADPAGAAFELLGTDGEPSIHGAERRITLTAPGLYHVYCSIHAMVMGKVGQWQVVMPRDSHATGYQDGNPMEAWFLAVQ